ncbi:DEAD-box ATP-dependent RNA helicase 50 [Benincasa hispida]|uniref:DEAD-box ATP-dependent RNA helicase 50 n=1 Tax=Benincasa hispida TaxID=102211 RepID=UPI001902BA64|nr:DEAD-box ATP-dependent RNA helicase 50 [Benincasa hispida]
MARAPIHTPANFLTSRSLESCYLRRHGCLRSPFLSHSLRPVPASKLVIVGGCVVAGYARKSVDSVGVYQLTDDEDFTVTSSEELRHDGDETDDDEGIETSGTRRKISIGSFGRLKTQKVRAIVTKGSRTKVEIRDDVRVPTPGDGSSHISDRSHSKVKTMGEKKRVNALRSVEKSRPSELQDRDRDRDRQHRTAPNLSRSEPLVPEGSAAYFRGWGSRGPYGSEYEPTEPKQQKFSSEKGFYSRKSFKDLGCSEYMIESLRKQNFVRPSQIQAKAFASVIEGKSCIISDQSGSGKTLAYLAPLIQRLRQEEIEGLEKSSSRSPQIVIIVPTAELASQVLSNCRSISKSGVPFRSMAVTGGFRQKTQLENLQEGVDVLIATPGRLMFLINEGFLLLSNLRCAVMDEVDILFNDEDFEVVLRSLMKSAPVNTQYLFVTATLPVDIYNTLVENFPDCEVIMGPGVHRISPSLEEVLVDCSGEDEQNKTPDAAFLNKKDALLQIAEGTPVSKTIVFCNKIETCRRVENALQRFDKKGSHLQVFPFHAALARESRLANMEAFTSSRSDQVSKFLVCTDRASRGIDFPNVDHVILFDFPRDPSEYVRRVGRTARGATGKGKAFIFVVGKQVSLARRIIERNRKGHPLHDVPSAYELTY